MNIRRRATPRLWLLASLLSLAALSSCVTIRDGVTCSVAGSLSAGGICSHTETAETRILSFNEMLDFLDAAPARTCTPVPGMTVCADDQSGAKTELPARGAAIVMSAEDWGAMKTALETACRELGSHCSNPIKAQLARLNK